MQTFYPTLFKKLLFNVQIIYPKFLSLYVTDGVVRFILQIRDVHIRLSLYKTIRL